MNLGLALTAETRPALDENGLTTHIHAQTPGLVLGTGDACEAWDRLYDEDLGDLAASIGVLVTDCKLSIARQRGVVQQATSSVSKLQVTWRACWLAAPTFNVSNSLTV